MVSLKPRTGPNSSIGSRAVFSGGGTAGCVITDRLAEDTDVKVLLFEAGSHGQPIEDIYILGGLRNLWGSKNDWSLKTHPNTDLNGPQIETRAKFVGGCSAINGTLYVRGSRTDYDNWDLQETRCSSEHASIEQYWSVW